MPNYVAIYETPEGVAVVIPSEERKWLDVFPEHPYPTGPRRPETDLEQIERLAAIVPPEGAQATIKTTRDLPSDRHFRGAWRLVSQNIAVDMPLGREIHRARIRDARAAKLTQLDVDYMRADEAGNAPLKVSIAAQKQALRDAPSNPNIETASTPEELKATWPGTLPNPYTTNQ